MTAQEMPFWLDIKTEYIDANLEKVIEYLAEQSIKAKTDVFYDMTSSLLQERSKLLLLQLSTQPIEQEISAANKKEALLQLRILGAYILNVKERTTAVAREAYFYFVKLLIGLVPDSYAEKLCEVALKCLTRRGIRLCGFSWEDLKTNQPEVIALKLTKGVSFHVESISSAWFQKKGSLRIDDGHIDLYEKNRDDSANIKLYPSLSILNDTICMQTASSDRISQSKIDDVGVMDTFTVGVMREQLKTSASPDRGLKQYQPGDKMIVKYNGPDDMGGMRVETMEGDYDKITGLVPYWTKVYLHFYSAQQIGSLLAPGCFFEAKYLGENKFDISESFLSSMIDNTIQVGDEVNAVLRSTKNDTYMWWTEFGYPAYVSSKYIKGTYNVGDTAYLEITSCASNAYVKAKVLEPSNTAVDENESMLYCIEGFPLEKEPTFAKAPVHKKVSAVFMRGLCRLLFKYQHLLRDASDRFRVLCICRILATMTEDTYSLQYLNLASQYIHNVVRFANDEIEKIVSLEPTEEMASIPDVSKWQAIIVILQKYGKDDTDEFLSDIIKRYEETDPSLAQLAKLIQSNNRIDDLFPAIKTVIKKEITKLLAIETVDDADFEKATSPDLGQETQVLEFKSSFFFPPKDAKERNQEKNVFKDLSSFLNAREGGVLFLGVDDNGHIKGLDDDIAYLERKVFSGNYKGLDGYTRYIQDRARVYFDLDVRLHFHIESAYDGAAVRILVDPYQHGVVEFDGIPYIRHNNASVEMDSATRRKIDAERLRSKTSSLSANTIAIIEAIREERKVVLHNYASSNSDAIRDRTLEPYAFIGDHSFVWCYDLEDNKNKIFRVSRIGNVEVLKEGWSMKAMHKKEKTDIFYFSGTTPIPAQLQLDLMARNLLLEEYPDAEADLSPMGENLWLLNTEVYQIMGLGRFFTGLANHITIIDAPELVEYAKAYFEEALKNL